MSHSYKHIGVRIHSRFNMAQGNVVSLWQDQLAKLDHVAAVTRDYSVNPLLGAFVFTPFLDDHPRRGGACRTPALGCCPCARSLSPFRVLGF